VGLLSALLTKSDLVFSDAFNHASIVDGIRLSGAKKIIYPHLNTETLSTQLRAHSRESGLRVIVTESLFSMDGDIAPLKTLATLAKKHHALLIVDEAHATGIFGAGLIQVLNLSSEVFATIHTGGKALGAAGAWVAGSKNLRDYLIQFSRAFIYSTAMIPAQALLLQLATEHWTCVGRARASTLFEKIEFLNAELKQLRAIADINIPMMKTPIIPIILGDADRTMKIAASLQDQGFDVRGIRPPTVPERTSRLRIILHDQNTKEEISGLIKALFFAFRNEVHE
jgi:8-amino-7-oxononanoate synthase